MSIQVQGLKFAQREMDRAMKGVVVEGEEMLTVMLQAIAANTVPYVPVDSSTLVNSERRSVRTVADEIIATIDYGSDGSVNPRGTPVQEYAVYVHEGAQKNWQKPGASNRFLAKGVNNFRRDDLSGIIARYSNR